MSRRGRRMEEGAPEEVGAQGAEAPGGRPGFAPRLLAHTAILVAVFAIVSAVAELAGAANLGVALGIGTIAFAIALVAVIVKG